MRRRRPRGLTVGAPPRKRRALRVGVASSEVAAPDPSPPELADLEPEPPSPAPPSPASPPPAPPRKPQLTRDLKSLGNAKAWTHALAHILEQAHKPLVVHGPTGCGKTCGVRSLYAAAGYKVLELDGVEAEDTAQLVGWVTRVRKMRVMQGDTAVLLDDFESFTPDARRALAKALARDDATLSPVIVTCCNPRDPALKALEPFAKVRLYAPRTYEIVDWFTSKGFTNVSQCVASSGDLRRVRHALEWRRAVGGTTDAVDKVPTNMFAATERLLMRKCPPDEWAHYAEDRDVRLVQEYLRPPDTEACAAASEYFAWADVCRATRYETHDPVVARTLVAHAAHLYTRAKDVDTLRPRRVEPPVPSDKWQMPSLLGGCSFA